MFSDMIQRGAGQFFRHISHGPSPAPSRRPGRAQFYREFAVLDHLSAQTVVLRTLIEEFGGEVVNSTLRRRLVRLVRWKEAKSDIWLHGILRELEHCGALTLEDVNGTEVIARVQPAGVALAYDPGVRHHQGPGPTS